MTEDIAETEKLNVQHRMKKVKQAAFGYLKNILWNHRNRPTIETRLKLYESIIRPTMISGLCALKLRESDKKEIVDFEKYMLRHLLGVRDRASMMMIYKLTGQLPITAHLDNAVLSLLHNIWKNHTNPIFKLVLSCLKTPAGKNTWAREAERILSKYGMPNLTDLFTMRCPEKEAWKRYRTKRIQTVWSESIEEQINTMKSARFSGPLPTTLRNKISTNIKSVKTRSDTTSTSFMIDIITDNLETNVQLFHRGKQSTDSCHRCGSRDTTEHAIFCRHQSLDWGVESAAKHFEKIVLPLLNDSDKKRYEDDDTFKLNVILHTEDYVRLSV